MKELLNCHISSRRNKAFHSLGSTDIVLKTKSTRKLPRMSFVEFKILLLLSTEEMHVMELRRALGNYGSVSTYLMRLEKGGFVTRRELDKWVINTITDKGREVLRVFRIRA